jgi:hypothetical protein
MTRDDWKVGDEGIRPAGSKLHCFYCREPRGGTHGPECAVRQRTVVVEARITYTIAVPEHWDAEMIELVRNEGSWCADNMLAELDRVATAAAGTTSRCLCPFVEFRYVREASPEDEAASGIEVADLPS